MMTSYRIRYRPTSNQDGYRYVDVLSNNVTTFELNGLQLGTEYSIGIMAFNKLGGSNYNGEPLIASTSSEYLFFFFRFFKKIFIKK